MGVKFKKWGKRLAGITLLGSLAAATVDQFYNNTSATLSENGEYVHSDPDTQKNIRYFLGDTVMSERDSVAYIVDGIIKRNNAEKIPGWQPGIEKCQDWQCVNNWEKSTIGENKIDEYMTPKDFLKECPKASTEFRKQFFKLMEEGGHPRVKIERNYPFANSIAARSLYTPESHTLHVDIPAIDCHLKPILKEITHAIQFNPKKPIDRYKNVIKHSIKGIKMHVKSWLGDNYNELFRKTYDTPGCIEHEAHRVIEPELENRYSTIMKSRFRR